MTVGWGVVGLGRIAEVFASELPFVSGARLQAVGSTSPQRAEAFASRFGATKAYGSYEGVIDDPDVRAVYIATPHPEHPRLAEYALRRGKAVLCEKPLALTASEAEALISVARSIRGTLLEGYMYRFHPRTRSVLQAIADGVIGRVQHVDAHFSYHASSRTGRLFSPADAGGGLLDVGGYPASFVLAVATAAGIDANEVGFESADGQVLDGIDVWTSARMRMGTDAGAHVVCGALLHHEETVRIYGSLGRIQIEDAWTPDPRKMTHYAVSIVGEEERTVTLPPAHQYAAEAGALTTAIAESGECPEMSWKDSVKVASLLDEWRSHLPVTLSPVALDRQRLSLRRGH